MMRRTCVALVPCVALVLGALSPGAGRAAVMDVAATSCDRYEAQMQEVDQGNPRFDPIDTVMWLFGFSVARSGNHVMYGGALTSFGFALDAQCKDNPDMQLGEALKRVKPKHDDPMDLTTLNCSTFEMRHLELTRTDAQSATTLLTWVLGFSVGLSDGHVLDLNALHRFDTQLAERCTLYPRVSVYEALHSLAH